MKSLDAAATEQVRRLAEEMGWSMQVAWAEHSKWEAECSLGVLTRRRMDASATVRRLEEELKEARLELRGIDRKMRVAQRRLDKAAVPAGWAS